MKFKPIPPRLQLQAQWRERLRTEVDVLVSQVGHDEALQLLEGQAERVRRERNALERERRRRP